MSRYVSNAKYHAKELDQGLDMAIERLAKLEDSTGVVKDFLALLQLIKSESKLVVESLDRASQENQEVRKP